MTEFRFDPATSADLMRAEVPAYGRLQQEGGAYGRLQQEGGPATAELAVSSVLDLRPGGRSVFGDVVIPVDRADLVIPVTDGHDRPSTLADQLHWLGDTGFYAATAWSEHDLVVLHADLAG